MNGQIIPSAQRTAPAKTDLKANESSQSINDASSMITKSTITSKKITKGPIKKTIKTKRIIKGQKAAAKVIKKVAKKSSPKNTEN